MTRQAFAAVITAFLLAVMLMGVTAFTLATL